MVQVALWEPEIPPNTGNIMRLCAATGSVLHVVGQPGFRMDDRSLKRAAIDYADQVDLRRHTDLRELEAALAGTRIICFTSRGVQRYTTLRYQPEDCLLFGSETRGLPAEFLDRHAELAVVIPMPTGIVRNLNLATSVGIGLYEALRQVNGW